MLLLSCHSMSAQVPDSVHVLDGDTITVGPSRYRLHGIDAPELDQSFGREAAEILSILLADGFTITPQGTDRYGRTIASFTTPLGEDVAFLMVANGAAWHWPRYAPDRSDLANAQLQASRDRLGLWQYRNPVPPWEWRRR